MLASRFHPGSFESTDDAPSPSAERAGAQLCEEVDSAHLLHGQREVLIRHGSEVYRLRHTRNDKLILTK